MQTSRWSRKRKIVSALCGSVLAATAAYAATNWVVGLNSGSSGEAQSSAVSNLTITATSGGTNQLYPGGTGDVTVSISNPNPFPVTITALQLPTSTTYAAGYSNSTLTTPVSGCSATSPASDVIWTYATGTSGTSHTLTSALTVAASGQANNPLVVTFTNDASMTTASPAACANTYFSMPSLTGITATGGGTGTATTSPATDAWTS
jgi:hypothetical protein